LNSFNPPDHSYFIIEEIWWSRVKGDERSPRHARENKLKKKVLNSVFEQKLVNFESFSRHKVALQNTGFGF
jgi:hypothetical protein